MGYRRFLGLPEAPADPADPPRLTELAELGRPASPSTGHLLSENDEAPAEPRTPASPDQNAPEILAEDEKWPTIPVARRREPPSRPPTYTWRSQHSRDNENGWRSYVDQKF